MKVLLLTTHLNIGGVSVYTLNLAEGLKNKGIEVFVGSSGGELVGKIQKLGIKHIKFNMKTKFEFHPKLVPALFTLDMVVKKYKIDIIHTQTRVTQVLGHFLSKKAGIPHVSTCHGFFKHKHVSRRIFNAWGDYTIAISDAVKEHLVADFGLKEERVSLIYTGVDCDKFASIANPAHLNYPVVGTVSRLSPVKGLKYLLFATKDLLRENPDIRLLLVGEGPAKSSLQSLAAKLGIEKNVFFASNTMDTQKFLSIMDVFVFYSLEEGLGLSLLEALAAEKPCVATAVGGIPSIIEDGVTGILVPPKDQDALKKAITRLLADKKLASSLAEKGKALVHRKFTLQKMVKEVINVYKKAQSIQ